ncbi:MAG: hypothetical protein GQ534_10020 [Candidatus Delongbacteria bacterium]|nr:hypothetical protein [Candidatus Delongbacteria bacterium]
MSDKTVFVIGAGASKEVNLPVGKELKLRISELLNIKFVRSQINKGDEIIASAFKKHVLDIKGNQADYNQYLIEAKKISKALPLAISIDNYIDAHRENENISFCGKLAIVKAILEAEGNSYLTLKGTINKEINFEILENTWYLPFFKLLTENCNKNDLTERFKKIVLIIFNYDRCVEQFLYYALQRYYDISEHESAELLKTLKIFHPYGIVGQLPFNSSDVTFDFGANPSPTKLLQLANEIKTFTEGTDPNSSDIIEIRKNMAIANKVVFLGFAFHKLNIELIRPNLEFNNEEHYTECYGSAYGIPLQDHDVINNILSRYFEISNNNISLDIPNSTCKDFFSNYMRSLSFAD